MIEKTPVPILVLSLILALAAAGAIEASTPNTGAKPWDTEVMTDGAVASSVTNHMTCVITQVRNNRVLEIWDEKSDKRHLIRVAEEVGIEARRKKDFDGRRRLAFSDLGPGQKVKVTYTLGDGEILGIKVIGEVSGIPGQ